MASYAVDNNKHTLLVTVFGPANKPDKQTYKLTGMMRIQTPDSETYMSPLPLEIDELVGLKFDSIEYVRPQGADTSENAGDLALTHYNADMATGQRNA
jgi:hypothetical protein